eukprot:scaffold29905_cov64-Phaeocystis_antarctica.AAC.6
MRASTVRCRFLDGCGDSLQGVFIAKGGGEQFSVSRKTKWNFSQVTNLILDPPFVATALLSPKPHGHLAAAAPGHSPALHRKALRKALFSWLGQLGSGRRPLCRLVQPGPISSFARRNT